ncbi:sulfatase [Flavivirga abyssicola]|uniref:sulfatase n=1 Tax=Flavivirga abyssicola TaxID=3063533 RepID=UPI0026E01B51|nr:sulfatase [Flavivirga sp. MEBiC07777]WVK13460.1 sulfatase [Flavivirga sp. MEBiC07777]
MTRIKIVFSSLFMGLLLLNCGNSNSQSKTTKPDNLKSKPNVLFIAVDDLRPFLGCYDVGFAQTPEIDKLASEGRLFKNHYVQVATCGASRSSMLRSRYPRTKNELHNKEAFNAIPRGASNLARTMPELFRKNGYETVCIGKISHSDDGWKSKNIEKINENHDLPNTWDKVLTPLGNWKRSLVVAYPNGKDRDDGSGYMPYSLFPDIKDNELPDGMFAETAINQLKTHKKSDKPFFMALGFLKPHLPFVAPKTYYDIYKNVEIPSKNAMQRGETKKANKSAEFYKYKTNRPFERPQGKETLSEKDAQDIRRAYMACVSYTDTQIGKVLKALKENGLSENTVVVLWGDHGWHLGEHNVWGKHTPLESALHSPLIIKIPQQQKRGIATNALAASIDIYPTLIDACNLQNTATYLPLEGTSLLPVINNPNIKVRDDVLSFWRGSATVVNNQYRLIVSGNAPKFNYELYDHKTDPGELKNISEEHTAVTNKLMESLKKTYPSVLVKHNNSN